MTDKNYRPLFYATPLEKGSGLKHVLKVIAESIMSEIWRTWEMYVYFLSLHEGWNSWASRLPAAWNRNPRRLWLLLPVARQRKFEARISKVLGTQSLSTVVEHRVGHHSSKQRVLNYLQRTRLSYGRLIRTLAHPLPSVSNLFLFLSLSVCRRSRLLTGEKREEKTWPSLNHSKLSGPKFNHFPNKKKQLSGDLRCFALKKD